MSAAPRLAEGVRLLGEYQGSGYTDPKYLIARRDDQVIQVSRLLYLVAAHLDGRTPAEAVAAEVSQEYGKTLSLEGLDFLVSEKLAPLGIAEDGEQAGATAVPVARPVTGLRFRRVVFPATVTNRLGSFFAPLFHTPVVVLMLLVVAAADVWFFRNASLRGAVEATLTAPETILAILGLTLVAVLFHEIGHSAACRFGGGRPGRTGVALFLVFPAFFTDVTDAYRLSRAARLRVDLGGLYFNVLFIGVLIAGYAATGSHVLYLTAVLAHVEMLQQLLPIVRLDGYFILCDVLGVPDLFGRVRPVLRSLLPGRRDAREVATLRPVVRAIVTAWVLIVIPLLVGMLAFAVWSLPALAASVWEAMVREWGTLTSSLATLDLVGALASLISLVLLPLPVIGIAIIALDVTRRSVMSIVKRVSDGSAPPQAAQQPAAQPPVARPPAARPQSAGPTGPVPAPIAPEELDSLTAEVFTDELMLRPRPDLESAKGWRRTVIALSGGRINPSPSASERRHRDLLTAVRTPASECRRVVVLSRKGGAGKTTTTLMLGHVMALNRGDRVVAIDANPDAGTLADRLGRRTTASITTLLEERDRIERYTDMRTYTSQADTRLEVLGSDDDPMVTRSRGADDYRAAIDVLDRHYSLVIIDTGTGILEDAVQGILGEADQVIVVMPVALDGARAAAMTVDWLQEHGHERLVKDAIVVINGVHGPTQLDLERVEEHFRARCSAVQRIPWDPALVDGARTALHELRPSTRTAYLELAALVGAGFARPGTRAPAPAQSSTPAGTDADPAAQETHLRRNHA
jgi:putative peptide zinc metalloprotease protein